MTYVSTIPARDNGVMIQPSLETFKARLGIDATITDSDDVLTWCLDVARGWVLDRIYAVPVDYGDTHPECVDAVLIIAARLYARRNSPEGVAGWNELGVVRIVASDPDVSALLERHVDYGNAGLA